MLLNFSTLGLQTRVKIRRKVVSTPAGECAVHAGAGKRETENELPRSKESQGI